MSDGVSLHTCHALVVSAVVQVPPPYMLNGIQSGVWLHCKILCNCDEIAGFMT